MTVVIYDSWAWRKICQVKTIFKNFLLQQTGTDTGQSYRLDKGYQWLLPVGAQVSWFPWMNQRWLLPKHSFRSWLIVQQRLLTQDRLMRMNIVNHNCCYLCGLQEESHDHLFFDCVYSKRCRALISDWCQVQLPGTNSILWWLKWRNRIVGRKQGIAVILAGLMYWIWYARNQCRIEGMLWRPEFLVQRVRSEACMRFRVIKSQNINSVTWIDSMM
ncbi:uncharacterized protein LOC141614593 [Silene latifolia]|uniref:uncharacterized protein LOC141614593 n=1 Tax=Silene latifolia TaxID=37657 RepID=UPI003D77EA21